MAWTYRDGRVWDGETVIADEVKVEHGRLIVAAPEMLAALKKAREFIDRKNFHMTDENGRDVDFLAPWITQIDAAIAAAEGKEPSPIRVS